MNIRFIEPDLSTIEGQLIDAVAAALDLDGCLRQPASLRSGGLAPWQEKRVTRHIMGHALTRLNVGDLAAVARLSTSHFTRAFRASFGVPPYVMIRRYRIGEAMRLMLGTNWPLADIAAACGFADQSHFTRTFHRHVDASPARWRRSQLRPDVAS